MATVSVRFRRLLKLSRMFFGPAFHDNFFVGIELDRITALAVHIAEETVFPPAEREVGRSEEHTSELQSPYVISYAVFCLKKKNKNTTQITLTYHHNILPLLSVLPAV